MMQRLPDWPERLAAYVEARRHRPFAWGSNDCVLFAAGALDAMTGELLVLSLLMDGSIWSNASEAAYVLREMGGLPVACHEALGDPIEGDQAALVGRGGVVCVELDGRPTLGIALGNGCWCGPGADGLVFRPMAEVRLAWEV